MPLINMINPNGQPTDTTSTSAPVQSDKPDVTQTVSPETKKRNDTLLSVVRNCKNYKRKLIQNWSRSIDYRRGKESATLSDDNDQVSVNLDWEYTNAKEAALFSQVPQARISHAPDTLPKSLPWCGSYERRLNDLLIEAGISACMRETVPDCINAAGIGVAMISYETMTADKELPLSAMSKDSPMEALTDTLDKRYVVKRISPADFLWPVDFTGSDFNQASWVGHTDRMPWTEAQRIFKLADEDKEKMLGDTQTLMDKMSQDVEKDKVGLEDMVSFDEVFYREYKYLPDATSFSAIHRVVFVAGKSEPVIDEAWTGQKKSEDGSIIGAFKYPIQVLTLNYITDEAIPPSNSAIARPQMIELNKGRTQQMLQRIRSLPVRWADINRIDPTILQSMMMGSWQNFIPVQGDGSRVIGEISRATMPTENFMFDKVARGDATGQWGLAPKPDNLENEDKTDPEQNVSQFNTQLGRERALVGQFFCNIAEVLGGLMCLYEDPSVFGDGFSPAFSKVLKFSILTDSTVLLDAGQKLSRLNQFFKMYASSGWINEEMVMQEIATLVGLDPSITIKAPNPKPPETPNISLRLTGIEDMLNPLALAFLINSGQAPKPEMIEQAKQLIQQSVTPPFEPQQSAPGSSGQELFGLPETPPTGGLPPGGLPQGGQMKLPVPAPPPGTPMPSPAPPAVGEANPNMKPLPELGKSTRQGGKQ